MDEPWDSGHAPVEIRCKSGRGKRAQEKRAKEKVTGTKFEIFEQAHSDPLATGPIPASDKRVDFSYNAVGQFTQIERYADLAAVDLVASTTYSYDGVGSLTDLTHAQNTTTLADYSWTFDDDGRVISFSPPDGTSNYSYDATGQLTGATHDYQADESYYFSSCRSLFIVSHLGVPRIQSLSRVARK